MSAESIEIKALCDGEWISIEILRDGRIIFLDRDIEYDLALCEFGEDLGTCDIYRLWQDEPCELIVDHLFLEEIFIARLTADWAEHVIPLFEKSYNNDCLRRTMAAFKEVLVVYEAMLKTSGVDVIGDFEEFLKSTLFRTAFGTAGTVLRKLREACRGVRAAGMKAADDVNIAAEAAANAVVALCENGRWSVGVHASNAAGYNFAPEFPDEPFEIEPKDFRDSKSAETVWQIRRFIDVLMASREDKDWPPLEATK